MPTRSLTNSLTRSVTRGLSEIGAGGFTPGASFFAGAQGFSYDLSDASKLYVDSARTVQVATAGDLLGSVSDLSGNGNHASQGTAANKPAWQTTYAAFDGASRFLVTPSINLTGTDKVTVVIGLQKSSDAVRQFLLEFSANGSVNPGSFSLEAPGVAAAQQYRATLYGTGVSQVVATTYPAGTGNVVALQFDIAGASSLQEILFRVDGATPTRSEVASPAGTGNFGNYAFYIGGRGGITLPLNGRIYRMVVIGRAVTDAERGQLEAWCGSPF